MTKKYFVNPEREHQICVNRRKTDKGSSYADRDEYCEEDCELTPLRSTDNVSLQEDQPKPKPKKKPKKRESESSWPFPLSGSRP